MKEKFIPEINNRGVHYGEYTKRIMNLFSRQEEHRPKQSSGNLTIRTERNTLQSL
jgi:hypothetical protein